MQRSSLYASQPRPPTKQMSKDLVALLESAHPSFASFVVHSRAAMGLRPYSVRESVTGRPTRSTFRCYRGSGRLPKYGRMSDVVRGLPDTDRARRRWAGEAKRRRMLNSAWRNSCAGMKAVESNVHHAIENGQVLVRKPIALFHRQRSIPRYAVSLPGAVMPRSGQGSRGHRAPLSDGSGAPAQRG